MTMRSFGNVMPIHIDMLRLAGYKVHWDEKDIRLDPDDETCKRQIRGGRRALKEETGCDFRFDLAAWRTFLLSEEGERYGYGHAYAFDNVDEAIRKAIRNPRRTQLVEQIEAELKAKRDERWKKHEE